MAMWRACRKLRLELLKERLSMRLLRFGLYSALVYPVVGLITSTSWTHVLRIWALTKRWLSPFRVAAPQASTQTRARAVSLHR